MRFSQEQILDRLRSLLTEGYSIADIADSNGANYVDSHDYGKWKTSCLSFLETVFGKNSIHITQFTNSLEKPGSHSGYCKDVKEGVGVINAALEDVQGGYLTKLETLVSADIFADFLEMSEHLLEKGYKDPAAVLVGGVLEEHLRKLCIANDIEITNADGKPVKANKMNDDLAKGSVYDKLQHKGVTYWLDLRNKAAHGEYDKYDEKDVRQMLVGVTDFASKYQP